MKKNILFTLTILVLSVSFISCSSDDDNSDNNTINKFKSNFYIGEEKQDIIELNAISYNENSKTINVLLIGDNDNKSLRQFHAIFEDVDFYSLKVGDDLIGKAEMVNYLLGTNKDGNVYTMVKDIRHKLHRLHW